MFLTTTGTNFTITELGYTISHPTTDFDILSQFSTEDVRGAASLTAAILAGTLIWRKTAGGTNQTPSNYDPDFALVEKLSGGTGAAGDQVPSKSYVDPVTSGAVNTLVGSNILDVINRLYWPTMSQLPVYNSDETLQSITFYQTSSQILANRMAQVVLTYNSNQEPISEVLTLYSLTDGTTVLKTITKTYTQTGGVLTNVTQVTA